MKSMKMVVLGVIAASVVSLAAGLSVSKQRSVVERNAELGRRVFTEIYAGGRLELVDRLYADDFVDDSPGGGKGRELIKTAITEFHKACPDLRMEIEDIFTTQDKVVVRYVGRGTQTGAYGKIPATGKTLNVRGITVFLIENGKIKTEWTEYDRLGILRQMGVVPS